MSNKNKFIAHSFRIVSERGEPGFAAAFAAAVARDLQLAGRPIVDLLVVRQFHPVAAPAVPEFRSFPTGNEAEE